MVKIQPNSIEPNRLSFNKYPFVDELINIILVEQEHLIVQAEGKLVKARNCPAQCTSSPLYRFGTVQEHVTHPFNHREAFRDPRQPGGDGPRRVTDRSGHPGMLHHGRVHRRQGRPDRGPVP